MNFIKKLNAHIVFLTVLYMMLSCTTVFAAETQLVFSSPSCNAGEEAVVEISLPQNSGVISVQLELVFDEALTLVNVEDAGILGTQNHKDSLTSPYVLSWENDYLTEDITSTGTLATLTFKVSEMATSKNYSVKVVRAELLDKDINDVPFFITEGSIAVSGKPSSNESSGGTSSANGSSGGASSSNGGGKVEKPSVGSGDETLAEEEKETVEETEVVKENTNQSAYIYNDVAETDWFYSYVTALSEKGIVSGTGDGCFNPTSNVTREQFLKMLLEAVGVEYTEVENTFADVDSNAWYAKYVLNAKNIGIVNGVSDTEFGIGTNITRQDMSVMINRVIEKFNIKVKEVAIESFADSDKVSAYAIDSVTKMKSIGLIQGYNNEFRPVDNLTRAEAAKVIYELLNLI